jgi:hypothetical protein
MPRGDPPSRQPSHRAHVAKRRSRAVELKNKGLSWQQVAEQMVPEYPEYLDGEGGVSAAFACVDVTRALKEANKELSMGLEEYREAARMRLDGLRRQVFAVLARPHYVLHQGQFVIDEDGNKVRDDGPVLAAVDRLLRIEERQAKIDGTDASEKLTIALDRIHPGRRQRRGPRARAAAADARGRRRAPAHAGRRSGQRDGGTGLVTTTEQHIADPLRGCGRSSPPGSGGNRERPPTPMSR